MSGKAATEGLDALHAMCLEAIDKASKLECELASKCHQHQAEMDSMRREHQAEFEAQYYKYQAELASQHRNHQAELAAQDAQFLVRNERAAANATELIAEIAMMSRANSVILDDLEQHSHLMCDLRQELHQAESLQGHLMLLKSPSSWMFTDGISGQVALLAEILKDHQQNMVKWNESQDELSLSQRMVDEDLLRQIEPLEEVLGHQNKLQETLEECHKQRSILSKQVESCLKALFENLTRAE